MGIAIQIDRQQQQRRVVQVLAAGQILAGIGLGAAMSLGALLVTDVTGSSAWSGMAATTNTLGAALLAVPLAALAQRRGRRVSLSAGAAIAALGAVGVTASAVAGSAPALLASMVVMGTGTALNFQARFAATDLAADATRGRDLSLVVWSTTIGAVVGPNLGEPSDALGHALGLPDLTGGFIIAAAAQLLGALVYFVGLRPDPLLLAMAASGTTQHAVTRRHAGGGLAALRGNRAARRAVVAVALSHAVMVALMGMTPVHLVEHGASLTVVGVTISLHVAGMYALSPVFGVLVDRLGGRAVVLLGQGLLAGSLTAAVLSSENHTLVTVSLILLGLGWSAATVAGATLVSDAVEPTQRARVQGVSDLLMNLAGAAGGAIAGPILAGIGFSGLAGALMVLVAVVVANQMPYGKRIS